MQLGSEGEGERGAEVEWVRGGQRYCGCVYSGS